MTDILTKNDCLQIIEMRKQGITTKEMEKHFFTSYKTINTALKQYDLWEIFTESKHFRTISLLHQAIDLRTEGNSTRDICLILDVHVSSLYRSLRFHKLIDNFVNARTKNPLYDFKPHREKHSIPITFLKNRREIFGLSYAKIAKEVGCGTWTVFNRCHKYNIGKADHKTALKNRELGAAALLQKRGPA